LIQKIADHDNNAAVKEFDIKEIEIEDDAFSPFVVGKKVKVLIQDMDTVSWKQELEEDRGILEKLIIFTAFADTARYLYDNIAGWAKKELGVYAALVTGSDENKTEMPGIRRDLASIITSFSPVSKERDKIDASLTSEIDLLIATDCISEGQNLQDCDYLINYDIHWNPVRIIQRFGRVDRLGSKNDKIQLVNFWPNMALDEYINLEARVSSRMVLLDISATGEENVIEFTDSGKMNDLEYRRKQLEKLQNEVVDIDDVEGGISITDLTLNDFRMDLSDYIKEHENLLERIPYGAYAVATIDDALQQEFSPGVIFCLKNEGAGTVSDASYALSPYYLVYVKNNGSVLLQFTQTKKILALLKNMSIHGKSIDIASKKRFLESGEHVAIDKKLFPETFTGGKVDSEALKKVLGTFVDGRDEHYSFTWNGKSKARMVAQTQSTSALCPFKESRKSVPDHVVYDSDVELEFATAFERSDNIKLYAKLPDWFKIDTPLGTYNPDWAVLIKVDGKEKLYFVVEIKSTLLTDALRPTEKAKIACGKEHFKALGKEVRFALTNAFEDFSGKYVLIKRELQMDTNTHEFGGGQ